MENNTHILILGEIKGTLNEFKDHTDRRFDEIKSAIHGARKAANDAQDKAEQAHNYAKNIVRTSSAYGAGMGVTVTFFLWVLQYIPKAFAAIIGVH